MNRPVSTSLIRIETRDWVLLNGLVVRSARLNDLLQVKNIHSEVEALEFPSGRLARRTVDPWSAIPIARRSHKTFVALLERYPVAFIESRVDLHNHRWVLTRAAITSYGSELTDEQMLTVWSRLIAQAARAAGNARAKRIHATFPEADSFVSVLRASGFATYAQETVMLAQRLPESTGKDRTRRQESSDVWSIHQLYHSITPRPVQFAEALTSNFWECRAQRLRATRGYLLDNGYEVVAYCRVSSNHGRHVMNVMVHQDGLELIETVICDVVADLNISANESVYVCVPDYTSEYVDRLVSLGFEERGRQDRMVKYIAVPRRMHVAGVAELAHEMPENVAAGTPSYFVESGSNVVRSNVRREFN